jgi:hypothetical protein
VETGHTVLVTTPSERTAAIVLAEIAEVRRHLLDAPPHHSGGAATLRDRLVRLEAELARIRRTSNAQPPAG